VVEDARATAAATAIFFKAFPLLVVKKGTLPFSVT
jgi:hypothetical protein